MAGDLSSDAKQVARLLRQLPADLRREIGREVRDEVARPLADALQSAAAGGPWGAQIAGGVGVRSAGAEPTIVIGGAKGVVSGGASVRDLFYGVNFGTLGKRVSIVNRELVPPKSGRGRARKRRGRVTADEVRAVRASGKTIFRRLGTQQFVGRHREFVFRTYRREGDKVAAAWSDLVTHRIEEAFGGNP